MISKGAQFLIVVNLITIILWIVSKVVYRPPFDPLLYISQISALVAATLISLNFILAAKLPIIEDWFGGLDRVFNNHHKLGKYAFILILLHPLMLVLNALPNWSVMKLYILPSSVLSYNFGVATLYLFVILLFVSLVVKIPFKYWRTTHDFMGIPIITLLGHVVLISSDVSRFLPLKVWMLFLVASAIICNFYIKIYLEKKRYEYIVESVTNLNNIVRIRLKHKGRKMNFSAGQFMFLKFKDIKGLEQYHPFTISSKPNKEYIEVTIKKGGEFTQALSNLQSGDIAYIKGPYGRFNEVLVKEGSLWIAGGIGITPFLSAQNKKGILLHQIKNDEDNVFKDEVDMEYFVLKSSNDQRVSISLIKEYLEKYNLKNIVLCGPSKFVKNLLDQLKSENIKDKKIYYELFELYSD